MHNILTVLGLIILVTPFLLLTRARDKRTALATISILVLSLHLTVGLVLQALTLFTYTAVLSIHSFIAVGVVIWFFYCRTNKEPSGQRKSEVLSETTLLARFRSKAIGYVSILAHCFSGRRARLGKVSFRISWVVIVVTGILFLTFYQVHFSYTGTVRTLSQHTHVENVSYPYPYYSDEWIAAAYANQAIETGSLPLENPLNPDYKQTNFFVPFHSLIAEVSMLVSINPLTQWAFLSTAFGIVLALNVMLLVHAITSSYIASSVSALWIPYILNGANIPMHWYLIPFTFTLIVVLLMFTLMVFKKPYWSYGGMVLTGILYPPLLVPLLPIFLFLIFTSHTKKRNLFFIGGVLLLSFSAMMVVLVAQSHIYFSQAIQMIFDASIRNTLTGDSAPELYIWRIVPQLALVCSIFAVTYVWKRTPWLFLPLVTGLLLWFTYSQYPLRFVIGYARIVGFTSVLLVVFSGIGLWRIWEYLRGQFPVPKLARNEVGIAILAIIFFILSFGYTENTNWMKIKLSPAYGSGKTVSPASPANMYLTDSDLSLFSNYSYKRFLSPPWKGLVIGAMTNNYPLQTKASAMGVNILDYNKFSRSSCDKQADFARTSSIDYVLGVISQECQYFKEVAQGSDGLVLYKFNDIEFKNND